MQVLSRPSNRQQPENILGRLVARLSRHILWDSLLLFGPPASALIFVAALLFRAGFLGQVASIVAVALTLALGVVAIVLRLRPLLPNVLRAARLLDQRSGAKDHFLTLATIDGAKQPASFLSRLRQQTEIFLNRVELKRDFPYQLKRSAYWSLGTALVLAAAVYLLLPLAHSMLKPIGAPDRLRELAQKMTANPDLRPLAGELQALAAKLEDPQMPPKEKKVLAETLEQKVEEQKKKEEQKDKRDLLGEAASALTGVEKQQESASGKEQQKDQKKGGGGIQTNVPQDGQGENKQSQGSGGESKGDSNAQLTKDMDQGKASQANRKEPGQDKTQPRDAKNNQKQPDANQPGKDPNQPKVSKTQGGSKDGAGKQQMPEQPPPQGGPQADRFYKAGEGKEGLAGAGYVTVQLPEEVVTDSKGESRVTKESKNNSTRTQVPVSNVPLPAHIPNAPTEKQQMPIEYRGIIR